MPKPGILTGNDIFLGDVALNAIDGNNVAWIITDLDGWWGLPDVEVPDDPRPFAQDGSYYTTGRYSARTINVKGYILPLDGSSQKAVTSRNAFNRALNLVRARTELKVREQGVDKVSLVQLSARPLLRIAQASGLLEFDISLKATDPLKYADAEKYFSVGLQTTTPGRTYPRSFDFSYGGAATTNIIEVVNEGSYASFPEFTVAGPILNPKIEHVNTGQELQFNTEVVDGQPLIIRPLTKQVLVQGQNRRNTLSPRSKWFPMYPGTNTLRFSGTQTIPVQSAMNKQINRALNPVPANSGTAGITSTEIRRNRVLVTKPTAVTGQYAISGGTGTSEIQQYGGMKGDSSWAVRTFTAAPTASTNITILGDVAGVTRIPVTPGMSYIVGASVVHSFAPTQRISAYVTWRDAAGASLTQTIPQLPVGPNNTWYRVNATVTAPAGAATASLGVSFHDMNGAQAGDFVGVTEFTFEDTSTNFGVVVNESFNPGPFSASQHWATGSGVTKSMVTDGGNANTLEVTVNESGAGQPGSAYVYGGQVNMAPPGIGNWTATSVEIKPLTANAASSMRVILRYQNGSTTTDQAISTAAFPINQWTRVTVSQQQLQAADNIDILIWPSLGSPVGPVFRVRKLMTAYGSSQAEAEAAVSTYIDGYSANTSSTLYTWAGTDTLSPTMAVPVPEFFDGSTVSSNRNHRVRWTGTVNASASTISIFNRGWDSENVNLFKAETTTSFVRRAGSTAVKFTRLPGVSYDKRVASIVNIGQVAPNQVNMLSLYPDFQNAATLYVNPSMEGLEAVFTFKYYNNSLALISTVVSDPQTLSMGSWQRIKFIDPTPAPSTAVKVTVSLEIRYTGADNAHIGAYVAVQDAKIGLWNTIDEDYFDGSYPFARWNGTAHWSESYIDNYVPEVPAAKLYITSRDAWIE